MKEYIDVDMKAYFASTYYGVITNKKEDNAMIVRFRDRKTDETRYGYFNDMIDDIEDIIKMIGGDISKDDIVYYYENDEIKVKKITKTAFNRLHKNIKDLIEHTQHLYVDFKNKDEYTLLLNIKKAKGQLIIPDIKQPIKVKIGREEEDDSEIRLNNPLKMLIVISKRSGTDLIYDERYDWDDYEKELNDIFRKWVIKHLESKIPFYVKEEKGGEFRAVLRDDFGHKFSTKLFLDLTEHHFYGGTRFSEVIELV